MDLQDILIALEEVEKKYAMVDAKKERLQMHRKRLIEMGRQGMCRVTRSMAKEMMDDLCDLLKAIDFQ